MDSSTIDVEPGHFFLGPVEGGTDDENVIYEAADLTTHGVIVGMTGSGKTGLGMILLEEALLQGIPTLVIDPKGDMGNLLLTFPELAPADFRPWVNEGEAQRDGVTPDDLAASTAAMWENGLGASGIGKDRIRRLREIAEFTIYTPGSNAGVGLNVIGDLSAPASGTDEESTREEIDGLVQGLLALVGVSSDPLSGREHVLLANLIHHSWAAGTDLDLATLLAQIQDPPMRKLGVIELDTFFPPSDRTALAMKLNGLLASPSFAAWGEGEPLDIASMLEGGDGKPKAAIVSIAHLSDEERQFAVTLILSKLVTWMRSQPGSPDLRAMVYMDEVFGFVPPTAEPPAKRPILTILKQARAFGVGMVLSTQNPVDLDYKAISNAGTWMIGRLQTERDKARLLEGMRAAGGDADIDAIGDTIGGLAKRKFLLHTTRGGAPITFGTRWAMSYLPGPLTRDQIGVLMQDRKALAPAPVVAATAAAAPGAPAPAAVTPPAADRALADDESAVAPDVADGVVVAFLDPAAPWAGSVGAVAGGRRLVPALAARVRLLFDETKGDIRHESEWEAIISPLGRDVDGEDFQPVDYDDRDLRTSAPEGAVYVLPEAKVHTKGFFTDAQRVLKDHLYRNEELTLLRNDELKLYSRIGESEDDFAKRCQQLAEDKADEEADELRTTMLKKEDRVKAAIAKAEDRVRELDSDSKDRNRNEVISGALDVIGGLLGGKKSSRSIFGGVRRASSSRRTSANAKQRLETAKNRVEEKVDELEELADVLTDAIEDSHDVWGNAAAQIVSYEVGLEKTDISVEDLVLVWVPTTG